MTYSDFQSDIDRYVRQKAWYWYAPVWLLGVYTFFKLLSFDPNKQMPFIIAVPQAFDFFLHETAHIVTSFLPALITAAAGSFSELLLATALLVMAFKQRSYFAVLITSLWFMLACQSVGTYMADARAQNIELVSLGGALSGEEQAIHDWYFIFGKLHLLGLDTFIGGSVRAIGIIVGLCGLLFSAWVMYKMADTSGKPPLA